VALYSYSQKKGNLDNLDLIIKDALFIKERGLFYSKSIILL